MNIIFELLEKQSSSQEKYSILLQALVIRLFDELLIYFELNNTKGFIHQTSIIETKSNKSSIEPSNTSKINVIQGYIDKVIDRIQINVITLRSILMIPFQLPNTKDNFNFIKGKQDHKIFKFTNITSKQLIGIVFKIVNLLTQKSQEMDEFSKFLHLFTDDIINQVKGEKTKKSKELLESQMIFGDIYLNLVQAQVFSIEEILSNLKQIIRNTFHYHSNPFYFNFIYHITICDLQAKLINPLIIMMTNFKYENTDKHNEAHFMSNTKNLIILFYKLFFYSSIDKKVLFDLFIVYVSNNISNPLIYSKLLFETMKPDVKMLLIEMIMDILIEYYNINDVDCELLRELFIPANTKEQHTLFYYIDTCEFGRKSIDKFNDLKYIHNNDQEVDNLLFGTGHSYLLLYYFSIKICSIFAREDIQNTNNKYVSSFLEELFERIIIDINEYNNISKTITNSRFQIKTNNLLYNKFYSEIKQQFKIEKKVSSCIIKQVYEQLFLKNNLSNISTSSISTIVNLESCNCYLAESNNTVKVNKSSNNSEMVSRNTSNDNSNYSEVIFEIENIRKWMSIIDIDNIKSVHQAKEYLMKGRLGVFFTGIFYSDKQFNTTLLDLFNKTTNYINEDKFFLKYPTKIKNYITDNYMRPFLSINRKIYKKREFIISYPYANLSKFDLNSVENIGKIQIKKFNTSKEFDSELITMNGSYFAGICICKNLLILETKKFINKDKVYPFSSLEYIDKPKQIFFFLSDIREVLVRRFLYMWQAVEIFLFNGKSYFINFLNKENCEKFYRLLKKIKNKKQYPYKLIQYIQEQFSQDNFQKLWKNNRMSTFDYLLLLNKFSGRSYHDLNQYPILPWIFSTYEDIKSESYRLFEYPITVQNEKKREKIMAKYEDEIDEQKAFQIRCHFHTHYSTSAFVYYYLARLEPITNCLIQFQTGKFDCPNRMFQSLSESKRIIEEFNDNRELIPELFFLPEMFSNINFVYFGLKDKNKVLNDIILPENCLNEMHMIYNHKNVLNSPAISKLIPKWIDNIFGSTQLIQKKESLNVFPGYSYEQIIDFESLTNKRKIENIKSIVINLGQTPYKLFNHPHPLQQKKKEALMKNEKNQNNNDKLSSKSLSILLTKSNIKSHIKSLHHYETSINKIKSVLYSESYIIVLSSTQIMIFNKNKFILVTSIDLDYYFLFINNNYIIEIDDSSHLICGNFCDKSLRIYSPFQKNKKILIYKHQTKGFITTITKGQCNETVILYSGNENGQISKWIFNPNEKEIIIKKRDIIGHKGSIIQIIFSKDLNLIISSAEDCHIFLRNIYSYEIINCIEVGYIPRNIYLVDSMMIYAFGKESSGYTLNGIKFTYSKEENENTFFVNNKLFILRNMETLSEINIFNLNDTAFSVNIRGDEEQRISLVHFDKDLKVIDCYLEDSNLKRIYLNEYKVKKEFKPSIWDIYYY